MTALGERWHGAHVAAENYHLRAAAGRLTSAAIADGSLSRPERCERCRDQVRRYRVSGRPGIVAHHHDYAKPLDVEWLCLSCHRQAHATGAITPAWLVFGREQRR